MNKTTPNWRKEFAPFNSNEKTAKALLQLEANVPGYLSDNEREFVLQVLGSDALEDLDALSAREHAAS